MNNTASIKEPTSKTPRLNNKEALPFIAMCIAELFWGISYMFTKVATQSATASQLLSIRFVIAFILINLMMLGGKHKVSIKGKSKKPLIILMLLQPVYSYCESSGVLYTNSTVSGVILSTVSVVSIVFAVIFLKEYPTRRQVLFCFLPVIGVIIITVSGKSLGIVTPIGIIFLILACVTCAAQKIFNKEASAEYSTFERSYFIILTSGVTFTFSALRSFDWNFAEYIQPIFVPSFLASVLFLSISCTLLAQFLINYAAGKLSVTKLASFAPLSTLCSMFAGVIFLGEPLTLASIIGSALIIFGIWQVSAAKNK
ncbi:MAG: DMT family transporter [Clostridiales bacterium]|nr:DMT family transporter [Clostridiales bacterium]